MGDITPPPRPDPIDRYELGEVLGRGGSGSVHRAWDRVLRRAVAIKVIPADDRLSVGRRRRETDLMSSVRHPALVAVLDVVHEPDATYLVMELVEGGTFRDRLQHGRVPTAELAAIATDVADALSRIHARGIVHRDVKPANVLLVADGRREAVAAKLADFGIARLVDTASTNTTGVVGTARYLSPEQARGEVAGPASDIYSFGLTLLEARTGRPAFPGPLPEALAARMLRDPEIPVDVGPEWRALLTAMTARSPVSRPDAEEVGIRVRRIIERSSAVNDDTVPLTVVGDPQPRSGGARRATVVMVAIGLPILLAGGVLLPSLSPRPAERPATSATSAGTPIALTPSPSPASPQRSTRSTGVVIAAAATSRGGDTGTRSDPTSQGAGARSRPTEHRPAGKPAKAKQKSTGEKTKHGAAGHRKQPHGKPHGRKAGGHG